MTVIDRFGPTAQSLAHEPEAMPRPTDRSVSLVIPAVNEAENIGWVLRRMPTWVDEVILVDGMSSDGTVAVARAARPDIVVLERPRRGKGAALREGFDAATCDYVVMIDADGSMDPAEMSRFVQVLDHGYDVVKGSRFKLGGGSTDLTLFRSLGNRALLALCNSMYAAGFTELCYGFFAFRRDALAAMDLRSDGFEIETEIVVRSVQAGLGVAEVASVEAPRLNGQSNLHPIRDGCRVLRTLFGVRFSPQPHVVIDLRDGHQLDRAAGPGRPHRPAAEPSSGRDPMGLGGAPVTAPSL